MLELTGLWEHVNVGTNHNGPLACDRETYKYILWVLTFSFSSSTPELFFSKKKTRISHEKEWLQNYFMIGLCPRLFRVLGCLPKYSDWLFMAGLQLCSSRQNRIRKEECSESRPQKPHDRWTLRFPPSAHIELLKSLKSDSSLLHGFTPSWNQIHRFSSGITLSRCHGWDLWRLSSHP